jgi:hypothetical protein
MTKNPIINALLAVLYIAIVASFMFYGKTESRPDTIIVPIAMISLFTFSAAVMGYIFLSVPLQLFLSGKKAAAVTLFVQTLAVFGVLTVLFLTAMLSGIL